jgi:lysozyme
VDEELFAAAGQLIAQHEGYRRFPYLDTAGVLTVGVGRNLHDVGISPDEAHYLLRNDMSVALTELRKYPWFDGLPLDARVALLDMMTNLGAPRFAEFEEMITAFRLGRLSHAAAAMLDSKWAQQVGERAIADAALVRNAV